MKKYIVTPGGKIREGDDILEWSRWCDTSDGVPFHQGGRLVAETVAGDARISTVFLGLEHPPGGILFETMVFGGPHDDLLRRYVTLADAQVGHADVVKMCLTTPPGE